MMNINNSENNCIKVHLFNELKKNAQHKTHKLHFIFFIFIICVFSNSFINILLNL